MRKRKDSKFVGKEFDNNWICTGINIASCTLSHKSGGPNYWYAFQRRTSDGKFDKWIRVEAWDATKIYCGDLLVEDVCNKIENTDDAAYGINYQFID